MRLKDSRIKRLFKNRIESRVRARGKGFYVAVSRFIGNMSTFDPKAREQWVTINPLCLVHWVPMTH